MTNNNSDIFTRSIIEEQFQAYLDEFGISSLQAIADNLGSSSKGKLLIAFIRDFISFKIDFDLMISLIGMIWIIDPEKFEPSKQTKVEILCFKSLELQWAIRNKPQRYINQIEELLEYYRKNNRNS